PLTWLVSVAGMGPLKIEQLDIAKIVKK
ncbi:MAG: hypothetical protein KR126chlam5_00886, partial [Candidatus Anoxychlamydiales bacterium]|nr:hypothetical protein [Candidatus Anoxychlamydiales bacterium]